MTNFTVKHMQIMQSKHDTIFIRKNGVLVLVLLGGKCCIVVAKGVTKEI